MIDNNMLHVQSLYYGRIYSTLQRNKHLNRLRRVVDAQRSTADVKEASQNIDIHMGDYDLNWMCACIFINVIF